MTPQWLLSLRRTNGAPLRLTNLVEFPLYGADPQEIHNTDRSPPVALLPHFLTPMTEFTATEEKVYTLLSEILVSEFEIPTDKINPDARLYEDFDIDSIDAVDMIVQLKPHLGGRRVSPEAFKQVRTLGDVVRVIARIMEEPAQ